MVFEIDHLRPASAFSRKGLIEQLEYEGFSNDDATYAVDHCGADWNEQAVARLKYILDETNAKIIISSDWRSHELPNKMLDLLRIHNLDKYWYADNIISDLSSNPERRATEIKDSLERYNIDNFIVFIVHQIHT